MSKKSSSKKSGKVKPPVWKRKTYKEGEYCDNRAIEYSFASKPINGNKIEIGIMLYELSKNRTEVSMYAYLVSRKVRHESDLQIVDETIKTRNGLDAEDRFIHNHLDSLTGKVKTALGNFANGVHCADIAEIKG